MEHFFDNREEASAAAAEHIADALTRRLDKQKAASLVVSGGTSPVRCFEALAHKDIDWSRVGIIPSDDRWVPGEHDDSNERLVRDKLLVNGAASADLLPFFAGEMSVEERAAALDQEIRFVPFPFACSLLGMGTDGHFASLFPDAENLAEGLDLTAAVRRACAAGALATIVPGARPSLPSRDRVDDLLRRIGQSGGKPSS